MNDGEHDFRVRLLLELAARGARDGKQIISRLDDGTEVVFRRDIGPDAHRILPRYPDPVDHWNIEVQAPRVGRSGRYQVVLKVHVVVDARNKVVDHWISRFD